MEDHVRDALEMVGLVGAEAQDAWIELRNSVAEEERRATMDAMTDGGKYIKVGEDNVVYAEIQQSGIIDHCSRVHAILANAITTLENVTGSPHVATDNPKESIPGRLPILESGLEDLEAAANRACELAMAIHQRI